jgi:uncharacterized protein (DUF697 family)
MALPFDVRDLMKSGTRFMEERSQPVRLTVFVEVDAPDELIEAVRTQLRPSTAAASLQVEVAELGKPPVVAPGSDVVVALAGSGNAGLQEALASPRQQRLPLAIVALGDYQRELVLADALRQPTADLLVKETPADAVERLGAWLSDNLASKKLALAHNFAFMRKAVAEDAVKTTAWQNGIVGVVTPIPGADMPIMTANQIKMLLQIAAAYGQPLNVDRVKELGAIVAGGYLLRTLARETLALVPVLGWAVKGGIAYTGTIAMGKAAIKYFEEGADLGQVTAYFRSVRDRAVSNLPKRGSKPALPAADVVLPPAESPTPAEEPALGAQQSLLQEDDHAGV